MMMTTIHQIEVNHAVNRLRSQPRALAAGSSIVYMYFNDLDKIYQFGPYGPIMLQQEHLLLKENC